MSNIILALAVSSHIGFDYSYNEVHPHIFYENNNYSVGAYYNSMRNTSLYAGYTIKPTERLGVQVGLVSGYEYSESDVLPFVRGNYSIGNGVSAFGVPVLEELSDGAVNYGIVLGLEFEILRR